MPNPLIAASGLLLMFAVPSASPAGTDWDSAVRMLQQHVTIHVPRVTVTSSTTIIMRGSAPPEYVEKKASDCVKMEKVTGFTFNRADSVDLVLDDGSLLRAKLGTDCPALGFYSGFYIRPNKDKKICAGRDALRSRSGRSCDIQRFASLKTPR